MFSTSRHGEVRGVRTPWEGTFFTFFSGSVRAPNRFPAWPPGEGGSWARDRGPGPRPRHRSRTDSRDLSSFLIASIVVTRSHSELIACIFDPHRQSRSRCRSGIKSTIGTIRSRLAPLMTSSRSSIARSDRELRSTLAEKFPRARSIPRALRTRVRPRKLGHDRSRDRHEQLRSILIDLRTSRRIGNFFLRSHR